MCRKLSVFIAAAILFSGCNGETCDLAEADDSFKKGEIYETYVYTPTQFGTFLGMSFNDYCEYVSEDLPIVELFNYNMSNFVKTHRYIIDEAVAEESGKSVREISDSWTINRYNFTYETTSYSGDPITLSAALLVPAVTIKDQTHSIKAISLCPPHMSIEDGYSPTTTGTVLMGRVMHNHAVVVPDFQGKGITAEQTYSCLHTYDHAVQAIDATLAAKMLLEELGYDLPRDIELWNIGVSEGGEKSYMIHKQIENDRSGKEQAYLNLKHNYVANGSLDHVQYVKDKISRVEYTGNREDFESDMEILATAFDCLTPAEKQGHEASEFYSTDILNPDGKTVNPEAPVVKVLEQAMERNNISYNCEPKTPLCLVGSSDDTTIKLTSHALPAYDLIHCHMDGSVNTNVSIDTFSTPIAAKVGDVLGEDLMATHIMADLICFIHVIEYEDPASHAVVPQLAEILAAQRQNANCGTTALN